jgi:hypothetical protein
MPAKGGQFEREICRTLSNWWTGDKEDDLFWRTSQSGGRATVRGRKGKGTRGHCGDITATDDAGLPLVKLITFELKRGYANNSHIDSLLDRPKKAKQQVIEAWIEQARLAAGRAGTPYWAIIHRRDRREACIYIPYSLYATLCVVGTFNPRLPLPRIVIESKIRTTDGWKQVSVVGMRLDGFLTCVDRSDILEIVHGHKRY